MRAIDADELKQAEKRISSLPWGDGRGNKVKFTWMPHEVQILIDNAPTIEPEPHWIPCSERLPEEKGEYLVAYHPCRWDDVEAEVKVGVDSFRGKTSWAKQKYQRVIAWMPLPPVYQEEDNK